MARKRKPLTKEKGRIEVILPPLRLFLRGCSIGAYSIFLLSDKYFYSNPACGGTGRIPQRGTKLMFFVKNECLRRGCSLEYGGRETGCRGESIPDSWSDSVMPDMQTIRNLL
jgi:hypothetical protein